MSARLRLGLLVLAASACGGPAPAANGGIERSRYVEVGTRTPRGTCRYESAHAESRLPDWTHRPIAELLADSAVMAQVESLKAELARNAPPPGYRAAEWSVAEDRLRCRLTMAVGWLPDTLELFRGEPPWPPKATAP